MNHVRFLAASALALLIAGPAAAADLVETPFFEEQVAAGALPPTAERLPSEPLVVDLASRGREVGVQGGQIRTMIGRAKDVRYAVVYGYARLVGYDENYNLVPDLLRDVEVEEGRKFTFHMRAGHKWSDGAPFTTEDFRYWWEDVQLNPDLSPNGPIDLMKVGEHWPEFTLVDETTFIYEWPEPNARLLSALAAARPPFIYRPAHVMKKYHMKYGDPDWIAEQVEGSSARNWAQLHNQTDNLYNFDNPDLPTLQPWINTTEKNNQRYILERNPYYHRVDPAGQQLPYVDTLEMTVAAGGLIPAKTNRGEADLQVRGLSFSDAPVLKKGEAESGYTTLLWYNGAASQIALYPNLTYSDPVWREVLRDARFRRALSLAIKRKAINKFLYFGLAKPRAVAALDESPFFNEEEARAFTEYDPAAANALLDEIGLVERNSSGVRLLPDGRPVEIVVETAGERQEELDALQLIAETWAEVGVALVFRPLDRDILRNRAYSGESMMPVWFGWNNGVPTPSAPPLDVAPVDQSNFSWPAWGQYFQTKGTVGEPPDLPEAKRLLELFHAWNHATEDAERSEIWREMLAIHADQVYAIGLVSKAPQPVVVSSRLRNVPEKGIYAWEPGAHLGVYRIDEFFFTE